MGPRQVWNAPGKLHSILRFDNNPLWPSEPTRLAALSPWPWAITLPHGTKAKPLYQLLLHLCPLSSSSPLDFWTALGFILPLSWRIKPGPSQTVLLAHPTESQKSDGLASLRPIFVPPVHAGNISAERVAWIHGSHCNLFSKHCLAIFLVCSPDTLSYRLQYG